MSGQPPWNKLPNDPRGFFGLAADFDRRDLKRAYRDLVRRFKPDRAPDEFRRIRAAYEDLESQLGGRAGRTSRPAAGAGLEGPGIGEEPRASEEVADGDPQAEAGAAAYDEVIGLLFRGERAAFWSALLDALDRFPDSAALLGALHEAYKEPPSVSPETLVELAVRRPDSEILVDALPVADFLGRRGDRYLPTGSRAGRSGGPGIDSDPPLFGPPPASRVAPISQRREWGGRGCRARRRSVCRASGAGWTSWCSPSAGKGRRPGDGSGGDRARTAGWDSSSWPC